MKKIVVGFCALTGLAAIASGSALLQIGWGVIFILVLGITKKKE